MSVFSFLVGAGLFWFACFLYVVHGIAQGEGRTPADNRTPLLDESPSHFARTRIKPREPAV